MLLRDVVGVALFAMVVGCGASSTASRPESSPVATVEQGRDAVLACLLVRAAVYRGGEVTMQELKRSDA